MKESKQVNIMAAFAILIIAVEVVVWGLIVYAGHVYYLLN